MMMLGDDHSARGVQRFEVFTGAGKRREWPAEMKASIVAETYSGLESVCAVARRHGLAASQLFAWRRRLRDWPEGKGLCLSSAEPRVAAFVPAVVALPASSAPVLPRGHRRAGRALATAVELEIDGVAVKIAGSADPALITAVIEALRTPR